MNSGDLEYYHGYSPNSPYSSDLSSLPSRTENGLQTPRGVFDPDQSVTTRRQPSQAQLPIIPNILPAVARVTASVQPSTTSTHFNLATYDSGHDFNSTNRECCQGNFNQVNGQTACCSSDPGASMDSSHFWSPNIQPDQSVHPGLGRTTLITGTDSPITQFSNEEMSPKTQPISYPESFMRSSASNYPPSNGPQYQSNQLTAFADVDYGTCLRDPVLQSRSIYHLQASHGPNMSSTGADYQNRTTKSILRTPTSINHQAYSGSFAQSSSYGPPPLAASNPISSGHPAHQHHNRKNSIHRQHPYEVGHNAQNPGSASFRSQHYRHIESLP